MIRQIAFTSSPELPQDEVLALLLFGKSVGNLSATQIAQLGAAVATLTGGSDSGPLAQIRKSLGLDAIDIDTSGEDGPSVSVGRYINDNIYLGVEQGASSGSSRVKVDIDLDRGLKVRGEVGADGSSKAGIFFEREY
jgi:translocation and assembly module TamB